MERKLFEIESGAREELYVIDCLARSLAKRGGKANPEAVAQVKDSLMGMVLEEMRDDLSRKTSGQP